MSMALFSPPSTHLPSLSPYSSPKTHFNLTHKSLLSPNNKPKRILPFLLSTKASSGNGAGIASSAAAIVEEEKVEEKVPEASETVTEKAVGKNGAAAAAAAAAGEVKELKFENPKWVNGTWDLNQFQKDGKPDWDAVIDAEVRRRKWFEDNPESSSNDNPIVFDTSIIPWWAWTKRFHLPEAELLNGRAAMIGFFMAYFVDSLTGVGLVDQMGNFFCKTLLFVAVAGVLLVRKNEDIDNLKKLLEETTFYDKQWQATWQDETTSSKKD